MVVVVSLHIVVVSFKSHGTGASARRDLLWLDAGTLSAGILIAALGPLLQSLWTNWHLLWSQYSPWSLQEHLGTYNPSWLIRWGLLPGGLGSAVAVAAKGWRSTAISSGAVTAVLFMSVDLNDLIIESRDFADQASELPSVPALVGYNASGGVIFGIVIACISEWLRLRVTKDRQGESAKSTRRYIIVPIGAFGIAVVLAAAGGYIFLDYPAAPVRVILSKWSSAALTNLSPDTGQYPIVSISAAGDWTYFESAGEIRIGVLRERGDGMTSADEFSDGTPYSVNIRVGNLNKLSGQIEEYLSIGSPTVTNWSIDRTHRRSGPLLLIDDFYFRAYSPNKNLGLLGVFHTGGRTVEVVHVRESHSSKVGNGDCRLDFYGESSAARIVGLAMEDLTLIVRHAEGLAFVDADSGERLLSVDHDESGPRVAMIELAEPLTYLGIVGEVSSVGFGNCASIASALRGHQHTALEADVREGILRFGIDTVELRPLDKLVIDRGEMRGAAGDNGELVSEGWAERISVNGREVNVTRWNRWPDVVKNAIVAMFCSLIGWLLLQWYRRVFPTQSSPGTSPLD